MSYQQWQDVSQCWPPSVGTSATIHLDPQASLQARLEAVSKSAVTEDGGLIVPSLPREVLQQQFMFAVAVQEGAAETRRLLGQMQQASHSLLQAARTGATTNAQPCIHIDNTKVF